HPDLSFRFLVLASLASSPRLDPALVLLPLLIGWHASPERVAGSRQLPRGVEIARIRGEPCLPDVGSLARIGKLLPASVEEIGILAVRLRSARGEQQHNRQSETQHEDIVARLATRDPGSGLGLDRDLLRLGA